jgi:3-phosphoshikimate 1-carboxyvinyltransferase
LLCQGINSVLSGDRAENFLTNLAHPVAQREIRPITGPIDAVITVPGSKSITNRVLLLAALADGTSILKNALFSEDSHWCADSLRRMGIPVEEHEAEAQFTVHGRGGQFPAQSADLFVGNSGTTARFLVAAATLGHGEYRFDGVPRMRERPIGPLLDALSKLGGKFTGDRFPLTVRASGLHGGTTELDATASSQYMTALLQVAPYAMHDVTIQAVGTVVSEPYIAMTIKLMAQFGVVADNDFYRKYWVRAGQRYRAQTYTIEPDASNATYFFAAAALTGGRVRIPHLSAESLQGDAHFVDVLEQMGCTVKRYPDAIEVQGPKHLNGIDIDMNAISDTAQTLAAIAPFAHDPVTIRNIGHVRHKETDRIAAVATELAKLGAKVEEFPDGLKIYPSKVRAGAVDTYDDHRMAMAFSMIGLVVPGIVINNPACTAKTFPDFFDRFEKLYG